MPPEISAILLTITIALLVAVLIVGRRVQSLVATLPQRLSRSQRLNLDYAINVSVNAQAELASLLIRDTRLPGIIVSELVCSLTTTRGRLATVHYAVESILLQSLRPASVELYLSDELSELDLPENLLRLAPLGVTFHFVPDVGPHTKLVYALAEFPERPIVTVDDDVYYPSNTIATLLRMRQKFPNCVVGNWARRLGVDAQGFVRPVRTGELLTPPSLYRSIEQPRHVARPSPATFLYGTGGVLYPAGALSPQAGDATAFRELCPTEDDIWFKAMALINGTPAVHTNLGVQPSHHSLRGSQGDALRHLNHDGAADAAGGEGTRQLRAVFDHFDLHRLVRED